MTTDGDKPAKQPAEDTQSKNKRGRSSSAGRTSRSRAAQQPAKQEPQAQEPEAQEPEAQEPEAQEQQAVPPRAQSAQSELSQILQQQIAQAIQPVLAEFRSQVAKTVEEERAGAPAQAANGVGSGEAPQQLLAQPQQGQPEEPQEPAQPPSPPEEAAQQQAQGQEPTEEQQPPADGEKQSTNPIQVVQGVGGKVTGSLRPVVRVAEQQAEHWLQSMLVAGLTAILAERTHRAAQHGAERGLHLLLSKAFGALPDTASNRDLQAQAEKTLGAILRESIDAVFAEETRSAVQGHGEHVVRESLHGNFTTALERAQEALRTMVQAFVDVLRRQWQRVLRLLLKIVLTALESSLASSDDDKPAEGKKGKATGDSSSK